MASTKESSKSAATRNRAGPPVGKAGSPAAAGHTQPPARELGICQTYNHQPRCQFVRAAR